MVGLKTHSKCVLVVRDDGDQLRRYCHIGTGNYNTKTSRRLRGPRHPHVRHRDRRRRRQAVQPPHRLQPRRPVTTRCSWRRADLRPRIARAHRARGRPRPGRSHHHQGQLDRRRRDDRRPVPAPARPATRIDLVIRGICCLRAGVPGLSETIRVRSILGRYLEHSRIYRFAHGEVDGAADLPHRLGRPRCRATSIAASRCSCRSCTRSIRSGSTRCWAIAPGRRHRALGTAPDDALGPLRAARRVRAARPGAHVPVGGRAPAVQAHVLQLRDVTVSSPAVHLPFTPRPSRSSPPFPRLRDEAAPPAGR